LKSITKKQKKVTSVNNKKFKKKEAAFVPKKMSLFGGFNFSGSDRGADDVLPKKILAVADLPGS